MDGVEFDRELDLERCLDWLIGGEGDWLEVLELGVNILKHSTKFRRFASGYNEGSYIPPHMGHDGVSPEVHRR